MQNFKLFILILLFLSLFSIACINEGHKILVREIILEEIERHPHSKVQDIYKFIHQASFGSEHAVKDTSVVRKWMEKEIAALDYSVDDKIIDQLSLNGALVRVNLRPYIKKKFSSADLLNGFIKTANNYKGSVKDFNLFWKEAEKLAEENKFKFTAVELNTFFEDQKKNNYPAVHHSEEYEAEYKPAYRVVDLQYLQFLIRK